MLDHMLISRNLLAYYRGSEIHNEVLHDESAAFALRPQVPRTRSRPVAATFDILHFSFSQHKTGCIETVQSAGLRRRDGALAATQTYS